MSAGAGAGGRGQECPRCSKVVKDRDLALGCDVCECWFHIACEGVTKELYNALVKFDGNGGSSVHWYCQGCSRAASKIVKNLTRLSERQEKLEGQVAGMQVRQIEADKEANSNKEGIKTNSQDILKMKADLSVLERRMDEMLEPNTERKGTEGEKKSATQTEVKYQISEALEREKRRLNVVVRGVPEEKVASVVIEKIFGELEASGDIDGRFGIVQVERIGYKKTGKDRLIRVRLSEGEQRRKVLFTARNLSKSEEFKSVYIMPDWTKQQVEGDRKLRYNLRMFREKFRDTEERVRIVRGKVIKGTGEHEEVLFEGEV